MFAPTEETEIDITIIGPRGGYVAYLFSPRMAYDTMTGQIRRYGCNRRMIKIGENFCPGYDLEARFWRTRYGAMLSDEPYRVYHHVTDDPEAWLAKIMLAIVDDICCGYAKIASRVTNEKTYEWKLQAKRAYLLSDYPKE